MRFLVSLLVCAAALCVSVSAAVSPGPYYGPVPLPSRCPGVRRAVVNPNSGDVYGTCFDSNTVLAWPGGSLTVQPIALTNSNNLCPYPQSAVLSQQGDLYVECWNGGGATNDFVLKFPQAQPASLVAPVRIQACGGGLAVSNNNTLYTTCYGKLVAADNGGAGAVRELTPICPTNNLATSTVSGDVAAACSGGSVLVWLGGGGVGVPLLTSSSGSDNLAVAYDNLGNLFSTAPAGRVSLFAYNAVSHTYAAPIALTNNSSATVTVQSLFFASGVGLYAANTDGSILLWPLSASNSGTVDAKTAPITVAPSGACANPQGLQVMPITNKVYCAALGANVVDAFVPLNKCA